MGLISAPSSSHWFLGLPSPQPTFCMVFWYLFLSTLPSFLPSFLLNHRLFLTLIYSALSTLLQSLGLYSGSIPCWSSCHTPSVLMLPPDPWTPRRTPKTAFSLQTLLYVCTSLPKANIGYIETLNHVYNNEIFDSMYGWNGYYAKNVLKNSIIFVIFLHLL